MGLIVLSLLSLWNGGNIFWDEGPSASVSELLQCAEATVDL